MYPRTHFSWMPKRESTLVTVSVCLLFFIIFTGSAVAKNHVSSPHGTTITVTVPIEVYIVPHFERRRKEYPHLSKQFIQHEKKTISWLERAERLLNTDINRSLNIAEIDECYRVSFHFTVDLMRRWDANGHPKWTAGKHHVICTRPSGRSGWVTTPKGGDPYETDLIIVGSEFVAIANLKNELKDLAYYKGSADLTLKRIKEILEQRGEKLKPCDLDVDIEFDVLGFGSWHPPAPAEILRGPYGDPAPTNWVRITATSTANLVGSDDGVLSGTVESQIVAIAGRGGSVKCRADNYCLFLGTAV